MREQEHEQLVDEITEKVLQRISLSFDSGDALNKINEIKNAIKNIAK